jgi:hypothetical protein
MNQINSRSVNYPNNNQNRGQQLYFDRNRNNFRNNPQRGNVRELRIR